MVQKKEYLFIFFISIKGIKSSVSIFISKKKKVGDKNKISVSRKTTCYFFEFIKTNAETFWEGKPFF